MSLHILVIILNCRSSLTEIPAKENSLPGHSNLQNVKKSINALHSFSSQGESVPVSQISPYNSSTDSNSISINLLYRFFVALEFFIQWNMQNYKLSSNSA